jgi:hypothetical protein
MVARHLTLKNKVCWVRLTEGVARSIKDLTEREKPLLLKSKTNILSLECWQLERETHKYCPVAQLVELLICNQWVGSSSLSVSSIGLGSSLQLPQGVKSL